LPFRLQSPKEQQGELKVKITTNQCRAALLTNLLVVGLAACSSTPAPWSRPDTSPWTEKHNTASSTVPVDNTVTQSPELTAPPEALPAEEAPPAVDETMPAAEPATVVPPPAEFKAKSVVSDINNEQRIMSLPGSYYAVQAYAAATLKSVEQFKAEHHLDSMMTVKTDRNGKTIYVLVETHPTRTAAEAASGEVRSAIGSKPWVRSVAGLQKVVKQQ
jgi:septal ring-binding cell division protein DamX